jgi:hypothetical protein
VSMLKRAGITPLVFPIIHHHPMVILGLDPRIILSTYQLPLSQLSVVRTTPKTRIEPEHDKRKPRIAAMRTSGPIVPCHN